MVRVLASLQRGPGLIPGSDAISGLNLCWFSSLLRGIFSGFSMSAQVEFVMIGFGFGLGIIWLQK